MMLRFTALAVYVVLAVTTTTSSAQDCTLNCPVDAPCVLGQADFSGHLIEIDHGLSNMHCDCPPGWTGLLCDRKYETCTDNNSQSCYHGGECIPGLADQYGNDQLFCDCSDAIATDGTMYVGKYCETPFDQICDGGADADAFCVNGGDCNPNYE
jgi:hypothetical protein